MQDGKQIDNMLDIQNMQQRHRAPKPIFLGLESEKSENKVPHFENFENILNSLTHFLSRLGHSLFQTSSRGSEFKQRRFGEKIRNTVQMQS